MTLTMFLFDARVYQFRKGRGTFDTFDTFDGCSIKSLLWVDFDLTMRHETFVNVRENHVSQGQNKRQHKCRNGSPDSDLGCKKN